MHSLNLKSDHISTRIRTFYVFSLKSELKSRYLPWPLRHYLNLTLATFSFFFFNFISYYSLLCSLSLAIPGLLLVLKNRQALSSLRDFCICSPLYLSGLIPDIYMSYFHWDFCSNIMSSESFSCLCNLMYHPQHSISLCCSIFSHNI